MSRRALIIRVAAVGSLLAAISSARAASREDVLARMDRAGPDRYTLRLAADEYFPKANEVRHYDLSKFGATGIAIVQFLSKGFGSTSEQLLKDYAVTLGGAEAVNETPATRIVLTPKPAETLKIVTTIELWIPDGEGYAIQQKATKPSKETFLATFSDLRVNPTLPDSAFQLNVPRSVKRINMN